MTGADKEAPRPATEAAASIGAALQAFKTDLLKYGFVALIVHGVSVVALIKLL